MEDDQPSETIVKINEYGIDDFPVAAEDIKNTLEIAEVKSNKANIANEQELPLLTGFKLKKPKAIRKPADKEKIPKIRLMSLIRFLIFPSNTEAEQHGRVTQIPPLIKQHGELSRHIEEAENLLEYKKEPHNTITTFTSDISEFAPYDTFEHRITSLTEKEKIDEHTTEHIQEIGQLNEEIPKARAKLVQDVKESVTIEIISSQTPIDDVPLIEEVPEETETDDRKQKEKVVRKKTVRKRIGDTQENIHTVITEEDGKLPQSTVTIEEIEIPENEITETQQPSKFETQAAFYIEELPEEVIETEVDTLQGTRKKVFRKRTIKERRGSKVESTEIFSVEEEGKEPQTSVTIQEITDEEVNIMTAEVSEIPEEIITKEETLKIKKSDQDKPKKVPVHIEELPEEIKVEEVKSRWGPKKKTTRKRVIRKRVGSIQEDIHIVTVEDEGKKPQTIVSIEQVSLPKDKLFPEVKPDAINAVEEVPEQVILTQIDTDEGPKKKIIKKRVFRKRKGSRQEETEILTIEEEGKAPQTSVVVKDIEVLEDEKLIILNKAKIAEKSEELISDEGYLIVPSLSKQKVNPEEIEDMIQIEILKKALSKQVPQHILPEEIEEKLDDTKKPNKKIPKRKKKMLSEIALKQPFIGEELPEEVRIVEELDKEGITHKKVIKKRTIKRQKGDKQEITTILTVTEENKKPQTAVIIEEIDFPNVFDEEQVDTVSMVVIEEIPEKVEIIETSTDGCIEKQILRKRRIKRRKGSKQETTELTVIEQHGKEPQSTVTIEEIEFPEEDVKKLPETEMNKEMVIIQENPVQVQVYEHDSDKKIIKRKSTKTRKGSKQETKNIFIVEEEGKMPTISVIIEEINLPEEVVNELKVPYEPHELMQPIFVEDILHKVKIVDVSVKEGPQKTIIIKEALRTDDKLELKKTEVFNEQPLIAEELPEEIYIVQNEGTPEKKIVKKRTIRTRKGSKHEITQILTVEEDGKQPLTTIVTEEIVYPEEIVKDLPSIKPEYSVIVEEIPDQIEVTNIPDLKGSKEVITKQKIIKKRKGNKQETTEITVREEKGKIPQSSVVIEENEYLEDQVALLPTVLDEQTSIIIEEFPEDVQVVDETKTIKKKITKKRKGNKEEIIEHVTVLEVGKTPQTSVVIEEIEIPDNILEELSIPKVKSKKPVFVEEIRDTVNIVEVTILESPEKKLIKKKIDKKLHEEPVISREYPEEIRIVQEDNVKKILKKKVIKTNKGKKEEVIQIFTVEEEDKEPKTSVIIEEFEIPEGIVEEEPQEKPQLVIVEEVPEEVKIENAESNERSKKVTVKKKIIKRRKGSKQESTEIVSYEEEGEKPKTTVTIKEIDTPEDIVKELPVFEAETPIIIQELPEEVVVEGQKRIKKTTIKKRKGSKQESVFLVTVEEKDKKPHSSIVVEEVQISNDLLDDLSIPCIKSEKPFFIEDIPEETIKITEAVVEEGSTKKIIRRKISKKESNEIIPENEEKQPHSPKIVEEEQPTIIKELPVEVQILEDEAGPKKTTKKRVLTKQKGNKQEITCIVTVEELGKTPSTTVTIEEIEAPKIPKPEEELPTYLEELPEEIKVEDIKTRWGPKKRTTKKRVLRKRKGSKQEDTHIITIEEDGKEPKSAISIVETTVTFEEPDSEKPVEEITELPEEVQIIERITPRGLKKQTVKKRVINKKKDGKQQQTEICTVEEEDKEPKTTVTIKEMDIPEELVGEINIYELPEEIKEDEVTDEKGRTTKIVVKKRVIKKPLGDKEEVTEITVVEKEGKKPEITVTIEEADLNKKIIPFKDLVEEKPKEEKPKQLRREVSVLMPLEFKKIEFQKVNVVDAKDVPLFGEVKLRKPKRPIDKKSEKSKIQIPRLKSRIQDIKFPSESEKEQLPRISFLEPIYRDNGVLSRNIAEAQKVPKTKRRKLRDKDLEQKHLEKLDLEIENLKKRAPEKVDDAYKFDKQPRKKSVSKDEVLLKIGKGEVPKHEEHDETVTLQKINQKPEPNEFQPEAKHLKEESPEKLKSKNKSLNEPEKTEFKPYDIGHVGVELEEYIPSHPEEGDHDLPKSEKIKKIKKKTSKPLPETEEVTLKPGKPKPVQDDEIPDVTFKYEQKPKPEEIQEDIKLKPYNKQQYSEEFRVDIETIMKHDAIISFEGEDIEIEIRPEEKTEKHKKKTIKKVKRKGSKSEIVTEEMILPVFEDAQELPETLSQNEKEEKVGTEIFEEPDGPKKQISKDKVEKGVEKKKKKSIKKIGKDAEVVEVPVDYEVTEIAESDTEFATAQEVSIEKIEENLEEQHSMPEEQLKKPDSIPEQKPKEKPKKPKTPLPKKEEKKEKIPRLKSRILHIPFPPQNESEKNPEVIQLPPVYRDNGILSRNVVEAAKIRKRKIKIKDYEADLKDLEKLDLEVTELKKKELEKVDRDLFAKPKDKQIITPEEGDKKLLKGKGQLPEQHTPKEEVTLKKVPEKLKKEEITDENNVQKEPRKEENVHKDADEEQPEYKPFKPYDIELDSSEKESLDLPNQEPEEQEIDEKTATKKSKKKKEPSSPETIEDQLIAGVPKPKEEDEITELKLTKKQKSKPEQTEEEIILKPYKNKDKDKVFKVEGEIVTTQEANIVFEGDIEADISSDKDDSVKVKDKRKISTKKAKIPKTKLLADEEVAETQNTDHEIFKPADEKIVFEESLVTDIITKPDLSTETSQDDHETTKEKSKKKVKILKPLKPEIQDELPEVTQLVPGKLVINRIPAEKPQIPLITEIKPEFAEIKLKKAKIIKKKSTEEVIVPKIRLKSKIQFLDFPPFGEGEQKPIVLTLEPVYRDNGILSRTIEEAKSVKPKKKKMVTRMKELEKIDKEFEELKKPLEEVDDEFRKRKEKPKQKIPILMKIKRIEQVTQKAKVIDLTPTVISFAEIKLKKQKPSDAKEPTQLIVPKLRLRSRIHWVDFPPINEELKFPQITHIGAKKDNAVLSRNVEEAEKHKKTKARKLKDINKELQSLEKLDIEFENLKKKEPEQVDETYKFEKKPKEKPEPEEITPIEIRIGKGKMPPTEKEADQVTLKKPSKKFVEEETGETVKLKLEPVKKETPEEFKPEIPADKPILEPFDTMSENVEILKYEPPEYPEEEKEQDDIEKPKYNRKNKVKPTPETDELVLEKGEPKIPPLEEDQNISLKASQKLKPGNEPEEIKLKPHKKQEDNQVFKVLGDTIMKHDAIITFEGPDIETKISSEEEIDKEAPKKKKIIRKIKRKTSKPEITEKEIPKSDSISEEPFTKAIPEEEPQKELKVEEIEPIKPADESKPKEIETLPEKVRTEEDDKKDEEEKAPEKMDDAFKSKEKPKEKLKKTKEKSRLNIEKELDKDIELESFLELEDAVPEPESEKVETDFDIHQKNISKHPIEKQESEDEIKPKTFRKPSLEVSEKEGKPAKEKKKPEELKDKGEIAKAPKALVRRLKSRITFIDFPPTSQVNQKLILSSKEPVIKQNATLSRNIEEAAKIKPKKKKKSVEPKFDELEKLDQELEDLKKGREKFDDEFRSRPEKHKKVKLVPMKIITVEVKPQKAKVIDLTPEVVNLAEVKLRKPTKKLETKEPTELRLPKLKLKSRINWIDFPTLNELIQPLQITHIGAKKENGVISRNIEEAEKIRKKRPKKLKDIEKEPTVLEKLDLEFEELKKKAPEKVDEVFKYERKPKQKPEEEEQPEPFKIGQGKVLPNTEVESDTFTLKKPPEKKKEEIPDAIVKEKPIQREEKETTQKEPEETLEGPAFEPFKFKQEDTDRDYYEPPEHEELDKDEPRERKPKRKNKKGDKPEPETIEIALEKGVPKPPQPEEENELTIKAAGKPKPEKQPEDIKLKPIKKPEEETDEKVVTAAQPAQLQEALEIELKPDDEIKSKYPKDDKIKRKKKQTSTEGPEDKPEKVPYIEEEVPEVKPHEEDTVQQVRITKKSAVKKEEIPEDIHITLKVEDLSKPASEFDAETSLIKETPKSDVKEDAKIELTIKTKEKVEDITEENIIIKKKKKKKPSPEEVIEIKIEIEKPELVEQPQDITEQKKTHYLTPEQEKEGVTITELEPEEVTNEVLASDLPAELPIVEEPKELQPSEPNIREEITEIKEVVIKKPKKRIEEKGEPEEEVTEQVFSKKKPLKQLSDDADEAEIRLPKPQKEEIQEVRTEALLSEEEKPVKQEAPLDTEAEFTIIQELPETQVKPTSPEPEVSEKITIKRKISNKPEEDADELKFSLKKDISVPENTIQSTIDEVVIIKKLKKPKTNLEDAAAELEILLKEDELSETLFEKEKDLLKKPEEEIPKIEDHKSEIPKTEESSVTIVEKPVSEEDTEIEVERPKEKKAVIDENKVKLPLKKVFPDAEEQKSENEPDIKISLPEETEENIEETLEQKILKPEDQQKDKEEKEDEPTEAEVVVLVKKPKKKRKSSEAEVTVKKILPRPEQQEIENDVNIKVTVPVDKEADLTIKKPNLVTEDAAEAEIVIKKYLPAEISDEPDIFTPPENENDDKTEIKINLPTNDKQNEEAEDQVTLKKYFSVPEQEDKVSVPSDKTVQVDAEVKIKKPKKKQKKSDDGEAKITIKKHLTEKEEPEEQVSIKKTPENEETEESIKKTKKSPKKEDEGEDEITVKKYVSVEDEKPERLEPEETVDILRPLEDKVFVKDETKPEGKEALIEKEEPEEQVSIKKKPEYEETEESIKKNKKSPKKEDEGEDEITIKKYVTEKDKPTEAEPEKEAGILKPFEDEVCVKDEIKPKDKEALIEEEEPEEQVFIKKRPENEETEESIKKTKKSPKKKDEGEDEITVKKYVSVEDEKPEGLEPEVTTANLKPLEDEVKDETKPEDKEAEAVFIKIPSKQEEQPVETEDEVSLKREKKISPDKEVAELKIKKKVAPRKPSTEEVEEEITVQRLKPVRKLSKPEEEIKEEEIPSVTFMPRTSKTKEDVEQEFKISLDSYAEEEISLSSKIKLKKPKRQPTFGEEAAEESVKIIEEFENEGPAIEEIIDEGSDAEELPLDDADISESFHVAFKRKPSRKYSVVHEDEEDVSLKLKKQIKAKDYNNAEIEIKIKPKRRESVSLSEDVSLSITKEKEVEKITIIHEEEVQKGDVYYSVTFYNAEAESTCDLVEGEKVYVVETQGDWWFVKKHLTEDSGWVPANILMDEPQYIQFVQKRLNEKIDKLPILEKPKEPQKPQAPKFLEKLKPITTHDGFSVSFSCKVEGYPRPQITWFRQTHIIKESVDFQMYYTEENIATLVINEVFPEDAGTFTCVAKNSAGFASSTAELTVEGPLSSHGSERTFSISRKTLSRTSSLADILEGMPPVFAKRPKTQSVPEETDVKVEAVLAAIPEPDIKWYRNGKRISSKENITIITTSENYTYTTTLKVTKIEKKQEGRYKIVAKNSEGHAITEFTLRVRTLDKQPPEVIEPLQSTTIRKNETITLTTTIIGNPEPAVQWFKDGIPLEIPSPKRNGDTYTVTIKKTEPSDTAEYTVKARNSLGAVETSAFLTVQEYPDNAEPPLFVKRFEEQNIPEKTPLILRAKVTGNPTPEVSWLLNNQPLESSDRIRILYDGENIELVIKETNSELDSGVYKCVATNSMGRASHGASVNVEVDTVKFTKKLQKVYETFERETIELECETSHSVRTKWWYNNTEISGMDHRVVIHDGKIHKLIIKNISKNDEGNYKCTVKNQKTETTVKVEQRKLEFVRKLQDLEITEKDNAILEVEITSDTANVSWFKDGVPISENDDKFETEKYRGVRKLLIRSTSIHDEGEYTCQLLEEECKADVTVIELPPEIITPLQDKTVVKGEKAVFEIELSKGDALAKWYKDGREIQFSEHIQLSIDGKRQKLKIYKSEPEDQGTYTCQVGKQSSNATLTVQVPSCSWIKPLPEETIVPIDMDAEFEVELSRDDVDVIWWRQDSMIQKSSRHTITKNKTFRKLVVHKVTMEDQYDYKCTVEKYDLKTSSKLRVGKKPSPPRGPLEVSGMTAQSFTIQWQPPEDDGNSPILEYIIEMKDIKSKRDFKKIGSTKGNVTDIAVVDLKKDHEYKFKIYARNTIGISEPYCPENSFTAGSRIRIDYHFAKTDETLYCLLGIFPPAKVVHKTPPSPPINLNIKDLTSRSATLTWDPPVHDGGSEITGYVVEKKLEYMPKWEKVYTLEAFTLEYTFENLKEKSDYVFRVFAENIIGLSAPAQSNVVQMRTLATVPSPPTAPLEIRTIGPNAIVVEWGIPESDGGAPLLGYNIALKDIKKTMWMEIGKTSKGVQKFTIRDLQEDHEYMIRIFARNEIGLSGPLESDEPFKVLPSGEADQDDFREATSEREPTSRSSETTTSWLRENSMDADIKSYAKGKLLRKDEYFFRIWCYATKLFK